MGAEDGGVVGQEFGVEGVGCVVGPNMDFDEGVGEEPGMLLDGRGREGVGWIGLRLLWGVLGMSD